MRRITIYQDHQGTKGPVIGFCNQTRFGWKFYPNMDSHKPSRKAWPTWEDCIPRWTGHPDRTISTRAVEVT